MASDYAVVKAEPDSKVINVAVVNGRLALIMPKDSAIQRLVKKDSKQAQQALEICLELLERSSEDFLREG